VYKGKRIFDLAIAFCLLPFVLALLLPVCTLLFVLTGKSPFFLQQRPGYHEQIFSVIKLKTMHDQTGAPAFINHLGRFLRTYSVDEMPQLFNVLKGEMSLIGPRPLLKEYLPLYSTHQRQRHLTRPGITGWAQVHGRNSLEWKKRFELDIWYVHHQSLLLDIRILLATVKTLFITSDVKPEGLSETEKFKGE